MLILIIVLGLVSLSTFVLLLRFSHGFFFGNNDFAAHWVQRLVLVCCCLHLVRVKLQTLHIDEFFDYRDSVEQLRILILPVPHEFDLGCRRRLKSDNLREILVLDRLVYG